MKAKGLFMFKSLQDREAGEFTVKDTGEIIKYGASNVVVCDEIGDDGKIQERRFKFPTTNKQLFTELSQLDPYTKIELEFDVSIYSANAKITPIGFEIA